MPKNTRTLGARYESRAADYLTQQGLKILHRNYRVRTGEIDLIAYDGEYLVFVEVKYRRTQVSGESLFAVTPAKQRTISRTAMHYLTTKRKSMEIPCRFDVIGIDGDEIHWIKNAFDYCG